MRSDVPVLVPGNLGDRRRRHSRACRGCLSNDQIAGRLVISPLTGKTHVRIILRKLKITDEQVEMAVTRVLTEKGPGQDTHLRTALGRDAES